MSSNGNGNGGTHTLSFRVGELEKDMRELWGITRGIPERISQLEKGQEDIRTSTTRLTMAIVGFTFTVASSAIAVLLALQA